MSGLLGEVEVERRCASELQLSEIGGREKPVFATVRCQLLIGPHGAHEAVATVAHLAQKKMTNLVGQCPAEELTAIDIGTMSDGLNPIVEDRRHLARACAGVKYRNTQTKARINRTRTRHRRRHDPHDEIARASRLLARMV